MLSTSRSTGGESVVAGEGVGIPLPGEASTRLNGRRPYPRSAPLPEDTPVRGPDGAEVAAERPIRLAALVVTYNRYGQITQTISRLLAESCDRIYVVDNGSTDGSRQWLEDMERKHTRLRLIQA